MQNGTLRITAIRTGRIFSFSAVEFRVMLPDGAVLRVWSPPWSDLDYEDPDQDAGAIEYGGKVWEQRQSPFPIKLNAHRGEA